MTGSGSPEQHAATVQRLADELHACLTQWERAMAELGWTMRNVNSRGLLDELVALASEPQSYREKRLVEKWEAAEARAGELQRERDNVVAALHDSKAILDGIALASVQGWMEQAEQARREADQLRAALREESARLGRAGLSAASERLTALAGVQADYDHDYVFQKEDEYRCDKCGRVSLDGVYPRVGDFHPHGVQADTWAKACPACKGYPDQPHRCTGQANSKDSA